MPPHRQHMARRGVATGAMVPSCPGRLARPITPPHLPVPEGLRTWTIKGQVVAGRRVPIRRVSGGVGSAWPPSSSGVVSQRSELAGAGQRAGQMEERFHEVGAALVADGDPPVGQQPGQRAFDRPPVATEPVAGFDPTAGDPRGDPAAAQRPSTTRVVVAFVGMEFGWAPAGTARASPQPDDRRDGVDQLLQQLGVVGVGGR
jgi:hypothetical protein